MISNHNASSPNTRKSSSTVTVSSPDSVVDFQSPNTIASPRNLSQVYSEQPFVHGDIESQHSTSTEGDESLDTPVQLRQTAGSVSSSSNNQHLESVIMASIKTKDTQLRHNSRSGTLTFCMRFVGIIILFSAASSVKKSVFGLYAGAQESLNACESNTTILENVSNCLIEIVGYLLFIQMKWSLHNASHERVTEHLMSSKDEFNTIKTAIIEKFENVLTSELDVADRHADLISEVAEHSLVGQGDISSDAIFSQLEKLLSHQHFLSKTKPQVMRYGLYFTLFLSSVSVLFDMMLSYPANANMVGPMAKNVVLNFALGTRVVFGVMTLQEFLPDLMKHLGIQQSIANQDQSPGCVSSVLLWCTTHTRKLEYAEDRMERKMLKFKREVGNHEENLLFEPENKIAAIARTIAKYGVDLVAKTDEIDSLLQGLLGQRSYYDQVIKGARVSQLPTKLCVEKLHFTILQGGDFQQSLSLLDQELRSLSTYYEGKGDDQFDVQLEDYINEFSQAIALLEKIAIIAAHHSALIQEQGGQYCARANR